MKDILFMYGVRNKNTGKLLTKCKGGRLYSRLADAKKKAAENSNELEIVTYRLIELKGEVSKSI